ncbi:MAG: OFA family MFS transporter [Endomicrobiia bacterium]
MKKENFYVPFGIIILVCLGSVYSWSVFRKPLEQVLNIGATQSGFPFMTFLLFFSLLMPVAGSFLPKLGPRKILILGNFLVSGGWVLSGFVKNIYLITITYGIIAGSGVGMIYGVPLAVAVKWFPEKKGILMGLILIGFGVSPLITAPLAKNLIDVYGIFNTFKILGIIFFIIIFILSLPFEFPDEQQTQSISQNKVETKGVDIDTKTMLRKKEFYGLWLCYTIGTFTGLMTIGITSPFAQEVVGVSSATAAGFVSIFALFNGIGRPIFGYIADKLLSFKTIIIAFTIITIASLTGLFVNKGTMILFVITFAILWMMLGGWLAIAPTVTSRIFGLKYYSSNYGVIFTAYGIGAILGTLISGIIKDFFGTYKLVFYPTTILSIIGIIIASLTLKPKKQ